MKGLSRTLRSLAPALFWSLSTAFPDVSNPFREAPRVSRVHLASASCENAGTWPAFRNFEARLFLRFEDVSGAPVTTLPDGLQVILRGPGGEKTLPFRAENAPGGFRLRLDLANPPEGRCDFEVRHGAGGAERRGLPDALRFVSASADLLFLVDQSGSMKDNDPGFGRFLAMSRALADPRVRQAVHEVAVVSFSEGSRVLCPFVAPGQALETALKPALPDGTTDLAAGMKAAVALARQRSRSRPLHVVLLTDGKPTTPYADEHRLLAELGATVHAVGLRAPRSAEYDGDLLRRIASQGGGQFAEGRDLDLGGIFSRLLGQLSRVDPVRLSPPRTRLAPGECPSLDWEDGLGDVKATLSLSSAEAGVEAPTAEVLFEERKGPLVETLLHPLAPGVWILTADFRSASRGLLARRTFRLECGKEPAPHVLRKSPVFRDMENESESGAALELRATSISNRLLASGRAMDLRSAEGGRLDAGLFSFEGLPARLDESSDLPSRLSLRLRGVEPGFYEGRFLLRLEDRIFAHPVSVSVTRGATWRGPQWLGAGRDAASSGGVRNLSLTAALLLFLGAFALSLGLLLLLPFARKATASFQKDPKRHR